jgi:hypothetical protein
MISSRFRILRIIPVVLVSITLLIFFFAKKSPVLSEYVPLIVRIFMILFGVYLLCILVIGELRTRIIKLKIYNNFLTKAGFIGLGIKSVIYYKDVDGYSLGSQSIRGGRVFETFNLISGKYKVLKLSEYYYANYQEMKDAIIKAGVKNLGPSDRNFIRETIEIFK